MKALGFAASMENTPVTHVSQAYNTVSMTNPCLT